MDRRHTLIPAAITGTALLWTATIATADADHVSDRLHMTLLTGSLVAVVVTLALAGAAFVGAQIRVVADELHDGVRQCADELHTAVEGQGEVLHRDRVAAVRTLAAHLRRDNRVA